MSEKFRGTFPHTIDSKGRMSVPTKFREALGGGDNTPLVVTRGTHLDCLACFPMDRWLDLEEAAYNIPAIEDRDLFIHTFISPAIECSLDKMGRVLIPNQLREYARLDREVMVVGALTKFEIWDRAKWEGYDRAAAANSLETLKKQQIRF
jgi:MraZ protein